MSGANDHHYEEIREILLAESVDPATADRAIKQIEYVVNNENERTENNQLIERAAGARDITGKEIWEPLATATKIVLQFIDKGASDYKPQDHGPLWMFELLEEGVFECLGLDQYAYDGVADPDVDDGRPEWEEACYEDCSQAGQARIKQREAKQQAQWCKAEQIISDARNFLVAVHREAERNLALRRKKSGRKRNGRRYVWMEVWHIWNDLCKLPIAKFDDRSGDAPLNKFLCAVARVAGLPATPSAARSWASQFKKFVKEKEFDIERPIPEEDEQKLRAKRAKALDPIELPSFLGPCQTMTVKNAP